MSVKRVYWQTRCRNGTMGVLEGIKSRKKASRGKKPRRVSLSTVVLTIVLVVGLGIMAYPTFSDWWNSFHQSRAIQAYVEAVAETDPKTVKAMFKAARRYNKRLANNPSRFRMSDAERDEYNSLLNLTGNGLIGYVQIPTIGVNLPIYHGVDETHLQVAVGHIEGSSLPVGGKGTHMAISAHRGLPSAKLFTDLDKVVEGDIFLINVLDRTFTYEVDQIRIVEPTDMSGLTIDANKDLGTLITCTPYGINTHRLLVRGHRVDNQSTTTTVPAGAVQIPVYVAIPAVAIPLLFVYLLITLIMYRIRRPELNTQEALDAVRNIAMSEEKPNKDAEDPAKREDSEDKKESEDKEE